MILNFEIKKTSLRGRGLFTTKNIKKGEVIENCPVLILSPKERLNAEKTIFNYYIYPWRSTRGASMVLGYGSIINHSFKPNADWKQNFKSNTMVYRAIKNIKKGEEITVNYNGEPDDQTPIDWFPE